MDTPRIEALAHLLEASEGTRAATACQNLVTQEAESWIIEVESDGPKVTPIRRSHDPQPTAAST